MYCVNYKRFYIYEDTNIDTIISNLTLTKYSNEGIFDVVNNEDYLLVNYYKKLLSAELVFDNKNETIHSESLQKTFISQMYINKIRNVGTISGNSTACRLFEDYLSTNSKIQLKPRSITYDSILSQLKNLNFSITRLSFSNVRFLQTQLPEITLEFNSNHDAFNIIKKLNSQPSKLFIKVIFNGDFVKLTCNLKSGQIKVTTSNINTVHFDILKDKLLTLVEENEDV